MPKKVKKEESCKVKTIDISKHSRDLSEEQIKAARDLIEFAERDGYRITQLCFF